MPPPQKFQQLLEMRRTRCLGTPRRVKSAPELLNVLLELQGDGITPPEGDPGGLGWECPWEGQKWNWGSSLAPARAQSSWSEGAWKAPLASGVLNERSKAFPFFVNSLCAQA